ncbi:MAG: hypothetical protein WBM76_06620, partial [Woeseiaceae bacterium]
MQSIVNKSLVVALCLAILGGCTSSLENEAGQATNYGSAAGLDRFCDRLPRDAYGAFDKHAASNDWFEVYEVATNTFAIYEPFQWQEVISYLIV